MLKCRCSEIFSYNYKDQVLIKIGKFRVNNCNVRNKRRRHVKWLRNRNERGRSKERRR